MQAHLKVEVILTEDEFRVIRDCLFDSELYWMNRSTQPGEKTVTACRLLARERQELRDKFDDYYKNLIQKIQPKQTNITELKPCDK